MTSRLCEVAYKVDSEKATSGEKEGVGLCSKCSMLGQDPSKYNSLYNQVWIQVCDSNQDFPKFDSELVWTAFV